MQSDTKCRADLGRTPSADTITVDWTSVASVVRGRLSDDTLSTDDGDALDAINGGGTNSCSTADGDSLSHC